MKQLSKLLLFSAALAFQTYVARAQDSPCLKINGDALTTCPLATDLSASVSVLSNRLNYEVIDRPSTLQNTSFGARYKAFWMFGDGNFRSYDYGTMSQDLATYRQTYVYPSTTGTYNPVVVLSERKSNTSPPRRLERSINIDGSDSTPGINDTFTVRVRGTQSLDIFNHDRNRPHYPTVFAISSLANDNLTDSVFFFYNCEKKDDGTFVPKRIHEPLDYVSYPNYFPDTRIPVEQSSASHSMGSLSVGSGTLGSRFLHFIGIGVNFTGQVVDRQKAASRRAAALRNVASNLFSEVRFFPFLVSTWDERWITNVSETQKDTSLPVGHYLALSVGSQPLSRFIKGGSGEIPNPLFADVLRYFPSLDPNTLQIAPNRYVRGIATKDIEMMASIDPNGLQIKQICPTGPNRYKVTIRMEVCNEGYMHEQDFKFKLIDHTGVIGKPEFVAGTLPSLTSESAAGSQHTWNYQWNVFLDGVPLPDGVTPEELLQTPKTCDTLVFTVETNWLGVQRLARGQGLELCVQFNNASEECNYNYKVDEQQVSPLNGYECGERTTATDYCCLSVYITLVLTVIILLLLIWILWLLKRKLS